MNKSNRRNFPISDRVMNGLVYAGSFLVSAIGMILIIKARGFYPFKDTTLFVMDMRDQYMNFYASLRYLFSGENSLFFNWSRSMGGNFQGLFAYYIANPLSFLTVLFPLEKMPLAIVVLTVLKIASCGLSFSMYAVYLWQRQGSAPWNKSIIIPLAVSYALMSYNITYLMCLMWLDGVIFLPWVLLGVEKILDGKRGMHYLLALTALFYANYYTGYMVGIFTALYLLYRVLCTFDLSDRKTSLREAFRKLGRFAAATLLSVGLAAPLLFSVIFDLFAGKLIGARRQIDHVYNFQPLSKFLQQFKNGVYTDLNYVGMPVIFCGYLILACAVLFFFMRKINLREKLGALLLLLFLLLSFYYLRLDLVWHGFQLPNSFPYRYAFLFSFVLLYMSLRALICISWTKIPDLWRKKPVYEVLLALFMAITALDLGVNGRDILFAIGNQIEYSKLDAYQMYLDATQPLVDSIKRQDSGLYRINQGYEYSKNDAMLLGYNGMTHYSSTYNQSVNTLTKKLGLAQIYFWNSGYGSTPLLDSLFGVKYLIEDRSVLPTYLKLEETGRSWKEDFGTTASYENPLALSFVYSAPAADLNPALDSASPFVNQNVLLNAIAGTQEAYFTECACVTEPGVTGYTYSFLVDSEAPVYFYLETDECYVYDPREVLVNGNVVGGYLTSETLCALYLGCFTPGQEVVVEIPEQSVEPKQAFVAQLHMERLTPVLQTLQEKGMTPDRHRGGSLRGSITVSEGETILTSIPYDRGWRVRVDGRSVEELCFADTFLAISAAAGEHTISLTYISPGFISGMIVFLAAVLLSFLYFRRPACRKEKFS